jgi:DNA polymerase-1
VNFGVLYGMGAYSLSKSLSISVDAAKDFIKAYFDRYPKVKGFLDGTLETARKKGYVETLFKRRRYIPDINSKDGRMKAFAERTAINAPVQGTASDLIKIAMVHIHDALQEKDWKSRMLLQVHDELVFDADKKELESLAGMVKDLMENAIKLAVPVVVSMKSGPNWMDMKKFEDSISVR